MAFNPLNIFPAYAGSGQATKLWTYSSTDSLATVLASGYFNSDAVQLGIGDIIFVSVIDAVPYGSRTLCTDATPIVVTGNASGVVTTRPQTTTHVRTTVQQFDDFEGTTLSTKYGVTKGSDGATANFAVLADTNGKIRATTGAGAGGTMAVNGVQLHSALNWKANQGGLVFETRVQISTLSNISVFVGLTDQVAALEAPVTSAGSANTITTNATDAVGFMFDTSMTSQNIFLVGVANDVDATQQDSGVAFAAATYKTLRIEVSSAGVATFYIDGVLKGTAMTGAVTPTIPLTPVVAGFTRTAASATIDADFVTVQSYRV